MNCEIYNKLFFEIGAAQMFTVGMTIIICLTYN